MTKQETFDFLGITKFHKAGYKGKNVRIMSDEKIIKDYEKTERWKNVICPNGYETNGKWHGSSVMSILQDVCPDATYYAYPFSGTFTSNSYKCDCADYIIDNDIHLFTTSNTGGKVNGGKEKAIQDCIDSGCTFFAAAGNEGENGIRAESKSDKFLAIGAVDDSLKWLYYSSVGEEIDYTMIAMYGTGTSYTTPTFVAMCGLVQNFFIVNAGRALKREELIKFIDDNLIDVEEEGFDVKTGKGLFILPDPSSIDIGKYVPEYSEVRSDQVMRGIDKLHPELQLAVNKFLNECKKQGLDVIVTETLRTQAEQEALYAKGRTEPGKIVTNCRGYQSPHCWGVAFDFCRNKKGWEYDNTEGFFDRVGAIAKTIFDDTEYDLFWGGDFRTFVDKPHVEMIKFMPNNSTKWLIDTYGTPEEFMKTWKGEDEIMLQALTEKYGKEKVEKALDTLIKQQVDNEDVSSWAKNTFEKVTKEDENGNVIIAGVGNGEYDWQQPITLERLMVILDKLGVLKLSKEDK